MTVDEKRKIVREYCDGKRKCDEKCLLNDGWCEENFIDSCGEPELNEAIVKIKETSNVDHPSHYQGKNECIDVMIAMFGIEAVKGFCKCNAFKYRFRAGNKAGNSAEQDVEKAEWYETYLMKLEGDSNA